MINYLDINLLFFRAMPSKNPYISVVVNSLRQVESKALIPPQKCFLFIPYDVAMVGSATTPKKEMRARRS